MSKQIASFEQACEALNIATTLPDVSALPEKHQKAIISHYKLIIIAQALNEGWEPDWNNWEERKYYPWFDLENYDKENTSGFGFSYGGYGNSRTSTDVGSRLCFKSWELAKYAGEIFIDLYKEYMMYN